jgi:hypothetical protein
VAGESTPEPRRTTRKKRVKNKPAAKVPDRPGVVKGETKKKVVKYEKKYKRKYNESLEVTHS